MKFWASRGECKSISHSICLIGSIWFLAHFMLLQLHAANHGRSLEKETMEEEQVSLVVAAHCCVPSIIPAAIETHHAVTSSPFPICCNAWQCRKVAEVFFLLAAQPETNASPMGVHFMLLKARGILVPLIRSAKPQWSEKRFPNPPVPAPQSLLKELFTMEEKLEHLEVYSQSDFNYADAHALITVKNVAEMIAEQKAGWTPIGAGQFAETGIYVETLELIGGAKEPFVIVTQQLKAEDLGWDLSDGNLSSGCRKWMDEHARPVECLFSWFS